MKIIVEEDAACTETELRIRCRRADAEVQRLLALLRAGEQKLTGTHDGQTFVLDAAEVLYIESVDKRAFLYTKDLVVESPLRLYELEDRLSDGDFFRASKSSILNLRKITSLRPDFSGRIVVSLQNGERVQVSRQYVPVLKQKLGL